MAPLIGPIGLDYIAGATRKAGFDVEILDLAFSDEPVESINGINNTNAGIAIARSNRRTMIG